MAISIYNSARFSLIVQIIICIICSYGLTFKLQPKDQILNELLILETVVQIVELLFYVGLVYSFTKVKSNVSILRYYDWFLTTPTMLFTLIAFMVYKNEQYSHKNTGEETNKPTNKPTKESYATLTSIFKDYRKTIMHVLLLNAAMLAFGVLGEKKIISRKRAFWSGSAAFTSAFYIIYENFADELMVNKQVLLFNFILWSLYGIAYMFPYNKQNIAYNILDIFSKNLNGLLIFAYIYYLAK